MRICQVVASWENGGLEKHVIELANALCQDHDVAVIAHPLMREHFDSPVQFFAVDFSQSRWSPKLHFEVRTAVNAFAPDIIHAQANKAAVLVGRLRHWLHGKSFIATLHNQKGSTGMFERFDHVIAVSPGIAHLVKKVPVTAIYNGIVAPTPVENGRQLLAAEFGFDAAQPILISIGRLVDAKGFDILIPAAASAGVQVLIVGEGERRPLLEGQLQASNAKIVLAGFRKDAQRLLAAADGFVLSSRNEGFAYVFVEALLAYRPVVVTHIPMVLDFVDEQLIVPVADITALAERMQWAVSHLDEWHQLMLPTWQKAQQHLTLAAMVDNTLAVYKTALTKAN